MQIEQLLSDYGVPMAPPGHKHHREGWRNVACPFHVTDHPGFHLGFTEDGSVAYCYSCGIHWVDDSLSKILKLPRQEVNKLIIDYAGTPRITKEVLRKVRTKAHKFPSDTGPLTAGHKKYLAGRGFDADMLEQTWDLLSTGPVSILDNTNYGHRVLAPIYWEGMNVTFQARDVTNRHKLKYLACPEEREIIKHKHIIYKHPDFKGTTAICSEGITDVWRFGKQAVATFGIEYTRYQVRLMAQLFKRVAVCFDDEPQAVRQANELIADLRFRKVDAFRIDIVGDPGGLPQSDADYIVKQIMK